MTLITFTTTQIGAFKIAFEAIESLVSDVLFVFTADGIHIKDIDKTGNLLVSAVFDASKFDTYTINKTVLKLGVAVDTIVKAVKTNLPYDVLLCEVEDDNQMTITLTSSKRGEKKVCPIKLTDVIATTKEIQTMSYDTTLEIDPNTLTKYVKDLNHVAESVILNVTPKHFELIGTVSTRDKTHTAVTYTIKNGPILTIQSDVSTSKTITVKRLLLLNKCVNLSPVITMCISNGLPLIFTLPMASLGELKLLFI
jgi:proliferating cell nuclear antigen PCNA